MARKRAAAEAAADPAPADVIVPDAPPPAPPPPIALNAWASTLPSLRKAPRVGQLCAAEGCTEPLQMHEECYYVIELREDDEGLERAVCWRHIRSDGPVLV